MEHVLVLPGDRNPDQATAVGATAMPTVNSEMRSPFPIPFGWFQVGWPGDLKPGDVKPLEYFGKHLALWRDDNGVAHLNSAFCRAPRRTPRPRRLGTRRGAGLPLPRLAVHRRWRQLPHPLLPAHQQEGVHRQLPHDRAQRRSHGLVPPGRHRAAMGHPRDRGVQRPRELHRGGDPGIRDRGAVAGPRRERCRLRSLPLRAPHRGGPGARELRDGRTLHQDAFGPEVPHPAGSRGRPHQR